MNASANPASQEASESFNEWFHRAWINAVEIAGPKLFACQASAPAMSTHWHQLTPKLDDIRRAISNRSRADTCFIAALVSFYNGLEGQKMLTKIGCTFGDLALVVTPQQRRILADLMTHYRGW